MRDIDLSEKTDKIKRGIVLFVNLKLLKAIKMIFNWKDKSLKIANMLMLEHQL